jgi:hypothetical protein
LRFAQIVGKWCENGRWVQRYKKCAWFKILQASIMLLQIIHSVTRVNVSNNTYIRVSVKLQPVVSKVKRYD